MHFQLSCNAAIFRLAVLYNDFLNLIKIGPNVGSAGYAGRERYCSIIDIVGVLVRVPCPTETQTDRPRQTHRDRQTD